MEKDRSLFKITTDVIAYRENSNGDDSDPITVRAADEIFAAVLHQATRQLNGKSVNAILFTLGLDWYWMARSTFDRFAVKTTAADRTSIPFQR